MDITLLIIAGMLCTAVIIALKKGGWPLLLSGLKQTGHTFKSMWFRLLLGMTMGGLIQVLIPGKVIAEWIGPASGLKGILIGSYIGVFISGGPIVTLPILASIHEAGAGVGPIIALLTGGMLSIQGLFAFRIPILGAKLALTHYIVCFLVPPILGLTGAFVYRMLNFT